MIGKFGVSLERSSIKANVTHSESLLCLGLTQSKLVQREFCKPLTNDQHSDVPQTQL